VANLLRSSRSHSLRTAAPAFTLVEAMVLLVIMSIVAVAAAVGLQSAVHVPEITDRTLAISSELNSEMEYWRSLAFGTSPWPSSLPSSTTDTVPLSIGGQNLTYSRTTNIQNWDPNNLAANTTPQPDFVRIQITINGQTLTCFLSKLL
jgi:type II secretory pathway pseudopilin PulG